MKVIKPFTPWKNGRSSRLKWRTSNHIPIEPASKKNHFNEIKTINSRQLKKIFDILCFPTFFRYITINTVYNMK